MNYRNNVTRGARNIFRVLQTCMKRGIYVPMVKDDPLPEFGYLVPLSGYIRIPSFNEEFLVRAIAQQPTLVAIYWNPGQGKMNWGKKIITPSNLDNRQPPNHVVNAVAYDKDSFTLLDLEGNDGVITLPRNSGNLCWPLGLFRTSFIPYIDQGIFGKERKTMEENGSGTTFNRFLIDSALDFSDCDITCYCPTDIVSALHNRLYQERFLTR